MNKKYYPWIAVGAVVLILVIWCVSVYNGLVNKQETVQSEWANVETQYQRRADLIPNLVETVKGYATHEQQTLLNTIAERAKASQISIDPSNATPEQLAAVCDDSDAKWQQALGRLMVVVEQYPDLKANTNFAEFQAQYEGTENRISTVRQNYNNVAKEYNTYLRRFPNNLIASMGNFEKVAYFEADQGAQNAPKVDFGNN